MTVVWGLALAVAVLWPGRLAGPLDGVPFDTGLKAVALGVVFPALWWLHPRFLAARRVQVLILALIAWKAFTAVALVQDGWCVRFVPAAPLTKDQAGAPHSWDVRADWRAGDPKCSAIMTRPYGQLSEFPAWFFNLPPPDDNLPSPTDRPPGATTIMTVSGVLRPRSAGRLGIDTGPDRSATTYVDGAPVGPEAELTPAIHTVMIDARLTGDRWRFAPDWNGSSLWPGVVATLARPSRLDLAIRPWGNWVAGGLLAGILAAWLAGALARIRDVRALAWSAVASCVVAGAWATGRTDFLPVAIAALAAGALVPVPTGLRSLSGAFVIVGIPWLTLIVVASAQSVGRFTLYSAGDDWWTFQRYAYRIFMQGYWLEGGQRTFWFQPFYRWIAGGLHLVFGDSSVGERYWEGACLLATSLFSFRVTEEAAGYRWGIVATVMTLFVVVSGPAWVFLGQGLSEISSAGLVYLAALVALGGGRSGTVTVGIAAGALATLAWYTRLNNLPMAFAVAAFALPLRTPVRDLWRPFRLLSQASVPTLSAIVATLGVGLVFFAWRTWHYTGVFSVFYGTQLSRNSVWRPGMPIVTVVRQGASSMMMVLTMNDPPQFDVRAIPLLLGGALSVFALTGVGLPGRLPLAPVLLCTAALAASLVARGEAYPGRFSIHVIAVTCTIVGCALGTWLSPPTRISAAGRPAEPPG